MVAACCRRTTATIRICGIDALRDPVEAKRIVAWVSDEPMIYDKLTPTSISNSSPACGVSS